MIINSGDFQISRPALGPGFDEVKTEKAKNTEKQFLLEGIKDVYVALPDTSQRGEGEGPIYPTIGKKLYPALDALEETMQQLGKHPTPEEVDRSNVRRLIRAFEPIAEAFQDSYKEKKFDKAMKKIHKVAGSLGKYKDVSVIETEIKAISPKNLVPLKMEKKLKKLQEKRAEDFREVFDDFRKEDMDKALEILSNPKGVQGTPDEIQKQDKNKLRYRLDQQLNKVEEVGLEHRDPHTFHEGRKTLRVLLNSMNACQEVFNFDKKDVDSMTRLVDSYGIAQDKFIAYEWLQENRFEKEAEKMLEIYNQLQQKALDQAQSLAKSGTLERVRTKIEE